MACRPPSSTPVIEGRVSDEAKSPGGASRYCRSVKCRSLGALVSRVKVVHSESDGRAQAEVEGVRRFVEVVCGQRKGRICVNGRVSVFL